MEKLIVINVIVTSLLTVARKFGCSCVYIFQITYWEKLNWRIILLQTKTFNIFPRSIKKSGVLKIISANCLRNTVSYILNKELWLNIPFLNLLNKKAKPDKQSTGAKISRMVQENLSQMQTMRRIRFVSFTR